MWLLPSILISSQFHSIWPLLHSFLSRFCRQCTLNVTHFSMQACLLVFVNIYFVKILLTHLLSCIVLFVTSLNVKSLRLYSFNTQYSLFPFSALISCGCCNYFISISIGISSILYIYAWYLHSRMHNLCNYISHTQMLVHELDKLFS